MIGRLWRRHRVLLIAFVVAVAATLFFGVRAVVFAIYWNDPAHRDEALAGWMTPRYVAMSWDLPREVVGEALGLAPGGAPRVTLDEIAAARGVPLAQVIDELDAAIARARGARP